MAVKNKGKQFENKFKEDILRTIEGVDLNRLPDQVTHYKGTSKNICDYLAYKYPLLYYIELKVRQGNTFNFKGLTQYDKLVEKIGKKGIHAGVII